MLKEQTFRQHGALAEASEAGGLLLLLNLGRRAFGSVVVIPDYLWMVVPGWTANGES